MKRIVLPVLVVGGLMGATVWVSLQQESSVDGVAGKESGPLLSRVSKTIRDPSRSPAAASATPAQALMNKIEATRACMDSGNCDYPNTDPHSYTFAVGHALASQLKHLRETYGHDPSMQNAIEGLSRDLMSMDDGFVREEAIKNLSSYPRNSDSVHAITENLRDTADPLIMAQAMKELERYMGTGDETAVQDFLVDVVARGGQFSSETASAQILAFLNERTADHFRAALNVMTPGSAAAKNLRIALDQYDRKVMGS